MDIFHDSNLIAWGIAIIIGTPTLVLVLSEAIQSVRLKGHDDYLKPLSFLRNVLVPLGALAILTKVAGFPSESLVFRIVQTAFWIAAVNSMLAFMNVIFFAEDDSSKLRAKAPKLFLDLLRFIFVLVGAAIVVSQVWGVNLTGLLTALGVGSIVIGLALQDTLGSIFSGIALLSARQFKVGDWINVGGKEGTIDAMTWRSVTISTRSGDTIVLPNTVLARDKVVNLGDAKGWHSELVKFTFAYDHPPETVKRVLTEAAHATPVVLSDPPPDARILEYAENGIVYQGRIFLPNYQPKPITRSDYQCMVWYHAQRAGLHFTGRHDFRYRLPTDLAASTYRTTEERVALIERVDAEFGTLEGLQPYLENARYQMYREGEALLPFGKIATDTFIIVSGTCRALSHAHVIGSKKADEVQEPLVLHEFTEGQAVLFKSLFRGEPTSLEVRATTDLEVLAIPRDAFEAYLSSHADLARKVEQILSAREEAASRLIKRIRPEATLDGTIREQRIKMLEDMFSE